MDSWDPVVFKTLLRATSQRLGQLQERNDSQGKLVRRDIAKYLSYGQLALARAKAAALIQEDMMGDLLEELEMFVGTVGRHVGELGLGEGFGLGLRVDVNGEGGNEVGEGKENMGGRGGRMGRPPRLSPVLVEAAASIIHAAPSTESKDLRMVREILIQRLGPAFAQTASASRNNNVSPRILQILSSPPLTALKMDEYLVNVAQTYDVRWVPEPRREDLIDVISGILRVDGSSSPIVNLPRLREICARGLPDDPPWVRPRIWRLLFGTLPVLKTTWARESQRQRDSYYDLVRRLLTPIGFLPSPTDLQLPTDALLIRISDSLFSVSPDLFIRLRNEPKCSHSDKCPFDPTAPDTVYIPCTSNLDKRLALLKGDIDAGETPEIRLESDLHDSSDSISPPEPSSQEMTLAFRHQDRPTTLLPSKAYSAPPAHRAHFSALLRLLYIHSTLNPAIQSPHVPWLLVPLYSALVGETSEDDVAHAEADTFWVFEALVGEIAEMEEEDGGKIWTKKLSERIRWADGELAASLHATGLDPILPHYSYRWLAPLLTQTLPLSTVLPVWDVLFARPIRTRDINPKLEHLVDICTALLIRARTPLFRLGRLDQNSPSLWAQEHMALPPPSPLRPWELSDAFTEGITLLKSYPIDAAGGIDRILQTASDLAQKRIEARDKEKEQQQGNVGFGARLKQQMWRGFTNQVADGSPEEEEQEEEEEIEEDETEEHDDGNETETPVVPTLTSRLANTVWRGITNQSSMDDEAPSPPSPSSARQSPTSEEQEKPLVDLVPSTSTSQTSLWNYAGKLKDSDTVAAFSKVSTNWRAKALDAWRVHKGSNASVVTAPVTTEESMPSSATNEIPPQQTGWTDLSSPELHSQRRGSLPGTQRERVILDPPRPSFFRSPRESFLPQPRRQHATAPPSPNIHPTPPPPLQDSDNESSASSLIHRAGTSLASLAGLQPAYRLTHRNVPRPLMLNSRDLLTVKSAHHQPSPTPSEGAAPEYRSGIGQWGEVLLANKNRHALRQASVSSASSLSPSEALNRSGYGFSGAHARSVGTGPRSDYDSDGSAVVTSRRVPLNRKSVSPMALASRSPHLPWNTSSLSRGRNSEHPLSNGSMAIQETGTASEHGWRHVEEPMRSVTSTAASAAMTGTRMTAGLNSPTTIASPPIPPTPLMPAVPGPGVVHIVNGGATGAGHCGTSSISTLSEVSEVIDPPLEPPMQSRLVVRKKTPPLPVPATTPGRDHHGEPPLSQSESEASAASMELTPLGKVSTRLRSKRFAPRPGNLRLRPVTATGVSEQQRTPSPRQLSVAREWPDNDDAAMTPKGESYSGEIGEEDVVSAGPPFVRKLSKEARLRKISTGSREMRRVRDSTSAAEEGDDEGYDDLLSAYESEEGSRE